MAVQAAISPDPATEAEFADRNSRHASLTLAFAQPGDTLLYLLLPLYHASFGVTLAEAGLLLAANRLVRIAGYGWVARFYAERGPGRRVCWRRWARCTRPWDMPACPACGRCSWHGCCGGLSFAAMNIATQALATAEPYRRGAAQRPDAGRSSRPVRSAAW
jgi:hypothetical protein